MALGQKVEAMASTRRGLALDADDDTRSCLLADLGMLVGPDNPAGRQAYEEAARQPRGNLVAQAAVALATGTGEPRQRLN
jgi:hypothetical protein